MLFPKYTVLVGYSYPICFFMIYLIHSLKTFNKIHWNKMKLVIVEENCDTLLSRTIDLLEYVLANKKHLYELRVELVKSEGGGPREHYIIAGTSYIRG